VPTLLELPSRRYGDRASKVRVRFNARTALGEVVDADEGEQMLTDRGGGKNLRVRNATGREGNEDEESDGDTGIEDLNDQLIRLIESTLGLTPHPAFSGWQSYNVLCMHPGSCVLRFQPL